MFSSIIHYLSTNARIFWPLGLILLLAVAVRIVAGLRSSNRTLPYYKVRLLSPAEERFFVALRPLVGENIHIFPKVRLEDAMGVKKGTEDRQSHRNRTKSRHLDFLLVDAASWLPVAGIELDDSSHDNPRAAAGDQFKDAAFQAADIPLIRIRCSGTYKAAELRAALGKSANVVVKA